MDLQWIAHRWCLSNNLWMLRLMVVGNLGIAFAYYSIPLSLSILLRRRIVGAILGRRMTWLFASFILLCGTTHIMDVVVIWQPLYLFQLIVIELTALVSIFTAIVLMAKVGELTSRGSNDDRYKAHRIIEESNIPRLEEILRHGDKSGH